MFVALFPLWAALGVPALRLDAGEGQGSHAGAVAAGLERAGPTPPSDISPGLPRPAGAVIITSKGSDPEGATRFGKGSVRLAPGFEPDGSLSLAPVFREATKVPKEPPLPLHEEVIRVKHLDPKDEPADWNRTQHMLHLNESMEVRGLERLSGQPVGTVPGKALFVDDFLVAASGGLVRQLVPAEKLGVVLEPSGERGPESEEVSFYGNVIHNGTHFLMFHQRGKGIGLAVSKDGLRWTQREALAKADDADDPLPPSEMCVQHVPDASREEDRWIAGVARGHNMNVLNSRDGLRWKDAGRKWGRAADTYPCVYREGGNWTVFMRQDFGTSGGWREIRGVLTLEGVSESADKLRLEEASEWYLDMYGKEEWRRRSIYALTRTKYRDLYLGLAQVYEFPYIMATKDAPDFTTDVLKPRLVTSRDGKTFDLGWIRREPLIPQGAPGEFDHGVILTAADWVTHAGYHWLYYAGWNEQHERKRHSRAKIGLARWKQDRLVRITPRRAEEKGHGWVLTRILTVPPRTRGLRVDAECKRGGGIRVRVLEAGTSTARLGEVRATGAVDGPDECTEQVRMDFEVGHSWKSIESAPIQLEFTLDGEVSLFGFEFDH